MILTKAVKSTSKVLLKNKWFWAACVAVIPFFAVTVIYLLNSILANIIGIFSEIVAALLSLTLSSVLFLGSYRVFWHCANGQCDSVSNIFWYFCEKTRYKRALEFVLRLFAVVVSNAVLLFLPSAVVFLISSGRIFEWIGTDIPIIGIALKNLGYVFAFAGAILFILRILNFYLSAFLFVSNDDITPKESILLSLKLSKSVKNIYSSHILGYIGWIVLSFFALPLVFTAPYLFMSYVVEGRYCVSYYNRNIEKLSGDPTYSF